MAIVHPKCPNCKKMYKFFKSDDESYRYMMKHESPTCPYQTTSYQDLRERCVEAIRELFKQNFPQLSINEVDERFTSSLALDAMITGGMKKKDRQVKGNVDKVSATLILQSYMQSKR